METVIIGAGFSGTMLAVHLARQAPAPAAITLVERSGRFGAGVAYSTPYACHLLNVPARRMSAFPGDRAHFARWARIRDRAAHPDAFLPRQLYAVYLAELLDEALTHPREGVHLQRLATDVAGIRREGERWRVRCADGQLLAADVVVLAIGNYPPANPPCETPEFYDTEGYRQDPWAPEALVIDAAHDVLLLGTGLTMVDVAIALDDRGHRGTVTCVSRRGLLPQWIRETGLPGDLAPPPSLPVWPRTTRGLLHGIRQAVADHEHAGRDWREVVASLRPVTPALWMSLSQLERKRFLRHARPYWDTHRHGAAPAIGRTIDALREGGRLRVMAGRVLRYDVDGATIDATVRRRGQTATETIRVQRVINCTGPDADLRRVASPLVQDLRERGMISPDPLGIGVVTDDVGRLVDRTGVPQPGLYLAGPLMRGHTWEHIAVPELREGAANLAAHLRDSSGRR